MPHTCRLGIMASALALLLGSDNLNASDPKSALPAHKGVAICNAAKSAPYLQPVCQFIDRLKRNDKDRLAELCHVSSGPSSQVSPQLEGVVATGGGGTKLQHIEAALLSGAAEFESASTLAARPGAQSYAVRISVQVPERPARRKFYFHVVNSPPGRLPGWYIARIIQPCF